jgi:deferrochelatase/peroxidase EfeB
VGQSKLSRRSFLVGAGGVAAGAGLATTIGLGSDRTAAAARFVPFHGPHQNGIAEQPTPAVGLLAAFTVVATTRNALRDLLRDLSDEIDGLMSGRPPQQRDPSYPPTDSGILGAEPRPTTCRWS